jgi:cyclic pyranopterin phosphate synthase
MVATEDRLSHLDDDGHAHMVDVGEKAETAREATASGRVRLAPATLRRIVSGDVPKGDVIATARLTGIQAAKMTATIIPLCHTVRLTSVDVSLVAEGEDALRIRATARAYDRTGVEMEALTAVSASALAVYDMVKAIDRNAEIGDIHLVSKCGGRSGDWRREDG